MTTPDVRPTYAMQEIMSPLLSPAEYAKRHDMGFRTVQRYLPLGRIEGAVQGEDGRWRIPADARVLEASATTVVRQAASEVALPATSDVRLASVLGVQVPVADVAAHYGTTVRAVKRMVADGHLTGGPYGGPSGRRWVILVRP
jgi:hypothetical protein